MSSGRAFLLGLGLLSALLIIGQLAMGQMIVMGKGGTGLVKAHQHSGYTTVLLSLVYILISLRILSRRS
ncbi:MAG: hypothetical protein ACKO85_15900 [Isosphaeraceae bacterium]